VDKAPEAFRTISEVAEKIDTPAHVLRFWESRFPQIKPVKRAGGRRYYRPNDVVLLMGIKHLLHTEGLTIRGVQKLLREHGVRHVAAMSGMAVTDDFDRDAEAALEAALAANFGARDTDDQVETDQVSATIFALQEAIDERDKPKGDVTAFEPNHAAIENEVSPVILAEEHDTAHAFVMDTIVAELKAAAADGVIAEINVLDASSVDAPQGDAPKGDAQLQTAQLPTAVAHSPATRSPAANRHSLDALIQRLSLLQVGSLAPQRAEIAPLLDQFCALVRQMAGPAALRAS
jgi:DNA-binding transcriptional MerR regulator